MLEFPPFPDSVARWLQLAIAISFPIVVSILEGRIVKKSLHSWYSRVLKKPWWTPPSAVFPVIWSVFYVMMGFASWLVWRTHGGQAEMTSVSLLGFLGVRWESHFASRSGVRTAALTMYGMQLAFNLMWVPIFFGWKKLKLAAVDAVCLNVSLFFCMALFFEVSSLAGWLVLPYFLWTIFATALSVSISIRNAHLSRDRMKRRKTH